MMHPADELIAGMTRAKAPVCVGLDPVADRLPMGLRDAGSHSGADPASGIGAFTRAVIDAVAPHASCVKFQSACFERYGSAGWRELECSIAHAGERGLIVIHDAKRGDIGISAEHYAAAAGHLGVIGQADGMTRSGWVTVSPYLGAEAWQPIVQRGGGAFALVRTSNPSGDAVQSQMLASGDTVAEAMARLIDSHGRSCIGESGFSALGAVVGATKRDDAAKLRSLMPRTLFLVPGYGAQGGGVDDVLPCFDANGNGAIITASRSVIYAFEQNDPQWRDAISNAAALFADELGRAVGWR